MVKIIKYIEIIAWLMSVYNFYARVVKDCKRMSEQSEQLEFSNLSQQVHNENCTNEPTIQPSQLFSLTL
jgi:cytochrome c-type biogenesis protein CcmH/NrfF